MYLFTLFFLILVGAGSFAYLVFFEGEKPELAITGAEKDFGLEHTIKISAVDSETGLKTVKVTLQQGNTTKTLHDQSFERQSYNAPNTSPVNIELTIEPKKLGLKEGSATLHVEAEDHSFRNIQSGNKNSISVNINIDTIAPKINILHGERYINPGGTGIFIYKITGNPIKSGLDINGVFHPAFLVDEGRDDLYISYFGLPFNSTTFPKAFIFAEDQAGNVARSPVSSIFKAKTFKKDRINVGDNFLNKKLPEFQSMHPELQGSPLEQYLHINRQMRKDNNSKIFSLCQNPSSQRLWQGLFLRMAGSARAGFADHRTYYYNGKAIDKQVHLGADIASTKRAQVKAANTGRVIYADYLGIYGNMILLDHGQGVFSLYSHLSQINVALDDMVEKGFVIGQTGISGMAGGDHLHFSMLVNGIFVNPKEWWDARWLDSTIEVPLTDSKFQ